MDFPRFLVLFLLLTFATLHSSAQEETCKLRKDKDDIKIYACHTDTSRLKSIRAEVIIRNASVADLKDHLMNIDNYVTWQYNLLEAQILEQPGNSEVVIRTVVDAPWPVSNREVFTRLKAVINADGNELHVEGKVIPYEYPMQKGLVRVPFSRSSWSVVQVNGTDLQIKYFLRVDPGGAVPAWLINLAVAEGPYESFRNLIAQLGKVRDK